jgi:hypothetical protein
MNTVVWIHYARPRPHWYALGATDQAAHRSTWASVAAASAEGGAHHVGRYHVRGQHDYETVEIWQFASAERAADHWARLTAAGYNEWFAFANNLGLATDVQP